MSLVTIFRRVWPALTVTGAAAVDSLNVGAATGAASGQVKAATAALTGALTAASAALTGALTAASVAATGAVTGASAALTGAITAATLTLSAQPAVRVYRNTNSAGISSSTETSIHWQVAAFDTTGGSMWSVGTDTDVIAPVAGTYLLTVRAGFVANGTGSYRRILLYQTGTGQIGEMSVPPSAVGVGYTGTIVRLLKLATATTFQVNAYQDSGGSLAVLGDAAGVYTSLDLVKVC